MIAQKIKSITDNSYLSLFLSFFILFGEVPAGRTGPNEKIEITDNKQERRPSGKEAGVFAKVIGISLYRPAHASTPARQLASSASGR